MRNIKNINKREHFAKYGVLYFIIILSFILSIVTDVFFTSRNLLNILRQAGGLIILALGQGLVLISGGIDLSVGSVAGLTGVVVAGSMVFYNINPVVAILLCLFIGLIFGFLNGITITYFKISPIIITLATLNIARGIAYLYTSGRKIPGLPVAFDLLGRGNIFLFIPVIIMITVIITIIFYIIATKTIFGRYTYAIGGNEEVARLAGISILKTRLIVYIICGITSSLVGIIYTSRIGLGDPSMGANLALDSIAAVVLGGISLYGGEGNILGVVAGAFLLSILNNGLNLLGVSAYWQLVVVGIVLVAAAMIYSEKISRT